MKYKATRKIEISDLSADLDGDGVEALISLEEGQYIPVSKIDPKMFEKSLHFGALKRCIKKGWIVVEPDVDFGEDEINEMGVSKILSKVVNWIISNDVSLKYDSLSYSGSVGQDIEVKILVTDGDGTIDIFSNNTKVVISYLGSVDTSKITLKDIDGNIITSGGTTPYSRDGIISLKISSSIAQTVTLTIVSNNRNLQIPNANAEIIIS
jgi:hypothetical protein